MAEGDADGKASDFGAAASNDSHDEPSAQKIASMGVWSVQKKLATFADSFIRTTA